MRIGTNGVIVPPVEALLDGARRAERIGYDSIWWPDHLMGWHPQSIWDPTVSNLAAVMPNPHIYLDPVAAIAAAAVVTDTITLGVGVTEPIRRHPAMIANEWLTLDHLSKGRVILGLGAGEAENIVPYGLDYRRQVSRFEEALHIIRLLWENDDPVSFDGDFWTLEDAVVGMGPYRTDENGARVYPPIWSGAHGPRMLSIVGRLCDGWLPSYLGGPDAWAQGRAKVDASAREAGRDPAEITGALWANVVVAETDEELDRILDHPFIRNWALVLPDSAFQEFGLTHPLGEGFYGLRDYIPARLSKEEAERALAAVPIELLRRYLLCGTPDTLAAELRAFRDAGLEHVVLWNVTYMADLGLVGPSYRLIGEALAQL